MFWSAVLVPTRWTVAGASIRPAYATSGSGVAVSLARGLDLEAMRKAIVFSNIENLTGSNFNDTLEGNAGNNVLAGGVRH